MCARSSECTFGIDYVCRSHCMEEDLMTDLILLTVYIYIYLLMIISSLGAQIV